MSTKNQLGQLYFIGLKGPELTSEEADFIVKNNIGGVTLFDRNLVSPQQIHKLCTDIQKLRTKMPDKAPLFIAIDMEGGRVHRLKPPFTKWPAIGNFADLDSTSLAFKFTYCMGTELKSVGINLDYAPCVDLRTNPKNVVIGDRSVGNDIEHVGKMVSALVRGYIKSGVLSCAKHFPGHGNTLVDSHMELPIETTDLKTLHERELQPFKKAFRARVEFCMTAHIKFTAIDPEFPVTLSKKFITDLLKKELRYQNVVMTDDLDMKALRNHYSVEEIPVLALQAGCDALLYCNEFDIPPRSLAAVEKAIKDGKVSADQIENSYNMLMEIKKKYLKDPEPPTFTESAKLIGHPEHLRVAKAVLDKKIPDDLST